MSASIDCTVPAVPASEARVEPFTRTPDDTVATIAERLLHRVVADHHATPVLVLLRADALTIESLLGADAVAALRGRVAPPDVDAVGFVAAAHIDASSTTDAPSPTGPSTRTDGTVAHVVDRHGTAATALCADALRRTIGPTTTPQCGRVPDACRRVLQLPTAPPDRSMLDFVVAAWLEIITRRALVDPSLDWPDLLALHPAVAALPDPATVTEVARATVELGLALDWERFRRVVASIGGFPFGEGAERTAEWMDAGMFSRWALDELADPDDTLEILDATLVPSVSERLWATVRLTRADRPD